MSGNKNKIIMANDNNRGSSPHDMTDELQKPFVKKNFLFMAISLAMIVGGFLLMTGSANGDVPGFNQDIFSTRRIIIGPGIAFLGFVAMAFAILYTPGGDKAEKNKEQ